VVLRIDDNCVGLHELGKSRANLKNKPGFNFSAERRKMKSMRLELIQNNDSGDIFVKFALYGDTQSFSVGFGSTAQEAESNIKGWITKDSEVINKSYRVRKEERFIWLMKKNEAGAITKSSQAITEKIFADTPVTKPGSITVTHVDF
jgi:hypothetical protein